MYFTLLLPHNGHLSTTATSFDLSLSKVATAAQKLHGGRSRSSPKLFSCSVKLQRHQIFLTFSNWEKH